MQFPLSWLQIFEKLRRVKISLIEISYDCVVIEEYWTNSPVKRFPTINLQSVAGWEYACLSQKTAYRSNLYVRALYMVVTLYITVTGQLPKIFSCLIFSAKLTCI